MTIHVKIGEADGPMREVLDAVRREEDVILDAAGDARVRVTAFPDGQAERKLRAAKRRAAIGMYKHLAPDRDIDVRRLRADDFWDERSRIKFDAPD